MKLFESSSLFPVVVSTKEYFAFTVWPKVKKGVDSPGGLAKLFDIIIEDGFVLSYSGTLYKFQSRRKYR